jgi:hypothetical protein
MWAYLLEVIAARQDKCVEIVAAARVSLSVRPSSSQLKKRFQRVMRQNDSDKKQCGLRSGSDIAFDVRADKISVLIEKAATDSLAG